MPTHHETLATLFSLLLLCNGQTAAGRLFEWVDKSGTTHFSDRAPVGLPYLEKIVKSVPQDARRADTAGIRPAEHILLKNSRLRKAGIERARQTAVLQDEQRQLRCRQARTRYREAIHRPGSAGDSDFRMYRRKMNEACD